MLTSAPVQSTYTRYQSNAMNGMLADMVNFAADTRIIETAAGIGFGLAVSQGTLSDDGCIIGGTAFVGITMRDVTLPRSEQLTLDTFARYDNAGIRANPSTYFAHEESASRGEMTQPQEDSLFITLLVLLPIFDFEDARWMMTAAVGVLAVVRLGNIAGNK